ncbi:hypothetical protein B4N84_10755 [Flavobacterium sp. IR1]|nr:hypothetical protein B4N84_10755 [Flavobacterium sp. IR1]
MVEYKSGPGSISASTIKDQFIEHDLFNANSLDQIQWRMEGTGMTADKLKTWMKENRTSINNLSSNKKKVFFSGFDELDGITDINIDNFVNINYLNIFR